VLAATNLGFLNFSVEFAYQEADIKCMRVHLLGEMCDNLNHQICQYEFENRRITNKIIIGESGVGLSGLPITRK
jgi:hypothetical protein